MNTAMSKRVQVLISTYNGEKYLREQIDSILRQIGDTQISLLIRDDGSTDGTQAILREYAECDECMILVGENIGVNASMRFLMQEADKTCDYFALSDQDDVWQPWKVAEEITMLEGWFPSVPLLAATKSSITDAELHVLGSSIAIQKGVGFYNAMIQNVCPGHTQLFNRSLLEVLLQSDASSANVMDWWI